METFLGTREPTPPERVSGAEADCLVGQALAKPTMERTRQQVADMRCEVAMASDKTDCRCELCFYAREVRLAQARIKQAMRAWSRKVMGRPDEED